MSNTKNRVVIIQNVIILTYLLACYLGPRRRRPRATSGRSLGRIQDRGLGRISVWPASLDVWSRVWAL